MDVNLTHANAITANVTLQPSSQNYDTIIAFLSGVVVALVVATIGAYVNYKIAQNTINASLNNTDKTIQTTLDATSKTIASSLEITNKTLEQDRFKMAEAERQEEHNKKLEAYSLLMGRKHTMLQSYASYYSMFIKSQSALNFGRLLAFNNINIEADELEVATKHRREARLTQQELDNANQFLQENYDLELDKSSIIKEHSRAKQRYEELQSELGRSCERFYEILGKVRILFKYQEVRTLIEEIEKDIDDLSKLEKQINQDTNKFFEKIKDAINSVTSIDAAAINTNNKRRDWIGIKDKELNNWNSKMFDELETRIEGADKLNYKICKLLSVMESEIKNEQ